MKEEEEEKRRRRWREWWGRYLTGKMEPDREGWETGREKRGEWKKGFTATSLKYSSQLWRSWVTKHCRQTARFSQLIRISAASFWGKGQDVGGLIAFYFPVFLLCCLCRFINWRSCRFTAPRQTSVSIITRKLLAATPRNTHTQSNLPLHSFLESNFNRRALSMIVYYKQVKTHID